MGTGLRPPSRCASTLRCWRARRQDLDRRFRPNRSALRPCRRISTSPSRSANSASRRVGHDAPTGPRAHALRRRDRPRRPRSPVRSRSRRHHSSVRRAAARSITARAGRTACTGPTDATGATGAICSVAPGSDPRGLTPVTKCTHATRRPHRPDRCETFVESPAASASLSACSPAAAATSSGTIQAR